MCSLISMGGIAAGHTPGPALEKATYELIDDPEPFYGEVPELQGLWATGKTLEECRRNLMDALDDWIAAHLAWGYLIPSIGGHMIQVSKEPMAVADSGSSRFPGMI